MQDVQRATASMQAQLQQQLCGNVSLSTSIRIIGYLKRLAVHSERELRVVFLQSRGAFLAHLISQIPTSNSYIFVCNMILLTPLSQCESVN